MPDGPVYLVTGANRPNGLGFEFVRVLLQRPHHTVIATVRGPATDATALAALPSTAAAAEGARLLIVHLDAARAETEASAALARAFGDHHRHGGDDGGGGGGGGGGGNGLDRLDVVIANAGVDDHWAPAADASVEAMRRHVDVNVAAPVALFRAAWPWLRKSERPVFVPISSRVGSLSEVAAVADLLGGLPMNAVYGASKAMLNYMTVRLHLENENLIAFPISPGFVQTDMGNQSAVRQGLEKAFLTPQDSVAGMMKVIDGATREKTSGRFWTWDGTEFAW